MQLQRGMSFRSWLTNRLTRRLLLFLCVFALIVGFWPPPRVRVRTVTVPDNDDDNDRDRYGMDAKLKPRIVLWTKFYGYDYSGAGVEPRLWDECQTLQGRKSESRADESCEIVYVNQVEQLRKNDAIIFHLRDLEWDKLPSVRHPNQIWIFFSIEAPEHARLPQWYGHGPSPRHIFNWTMTYRRDSDVPYPYGIITKRNHISSSRQNSSSTRGTRLQRQRLRFHKTRLAGVAITHCNTPSRRESYIRTLQHYANKVDVYGQCSHNDTCGFTDGIQSCQSMACRFTQFRSCYSALARTHKFYLSFENSLCADYVTEKFFMALQQHIVPVVYGGLVANRGRDYSDLAPRYSYINAREFKSQAELAKYLRWLSLNPNEYVKYFEWKRDYEVSVSQAVGWCNLCRKLHEWRAMGESDTRKRSSYENVGEWWTTMTTRVPIPTVTMKNGSKIVTKSKTSACDKQPSYEYEGWQDPKFNRQY